MLFTASKLIQMVLAPSNLLIGTLGLGAVLMLAGWRAGKPVAVAGLLGLLLFGVLPGGTLALRALEDRFPQAPQDMPPPDGIIVLGGSTDQALEASRHRVAITEAAERLTEAVILARRYPAARLVFAGGTALVGGSAFSEGDDARRLWTGMGLPDQRLTIESRSRTTEENVRFAKELVGPRPGQRWLLVTSAFHMPRAVGLFRADDWPVIPYPVDFHTHGTAADLRPSVLIVRNLGRLDVAAHEWVGLVVSRVTGRINSLLPAP